jgi:hypothetical protein
MSIRATGVLAALWILSLLLVASIVHAQSYRVNPVPPRVVTGADFGFRIEGEQNGAPVGVPVVRINGEWMAVKLGAAQGEVRPAH